MSARDAYEILGLPRLPQPTLQQINKAHRLYAFQHHPDRNPDDRGAETRLKEANAARDKLIQAIEQLERMPVSYPAPYPPGTCYRRPTPPPESRTRCRSSADADPQRAWKRTVQGRHPSAFRPYSPSDRYKKGDLIEHPKFGSGVVDTLLEAPKLRVRFREGARILIHAYSRTS
jgi:hypothetical protein